MDGGDGDTSPPSTQARAHFTQAHTTGVRIHFTQAHTEKHISHRHAPYTHHSPPPPQLAHASPPHTHTIFQGSL